MTAGESKGQVTGLLIAWGNGDRTAYELLIPMVYKELHRLAARYLRRERSDHTLQPTALVHEAYLRLIDQNSARWQNRAQFFGVAAQAMRRILVDHARNRTAQKRGGGAIRLTLDNSSEEGEAKTIDVRLAIPPLNIDLIDLDEALTELGVLDPDLVRVVELRYFGGLTVEETAAAIGVSPATIKRDWSAARAWLFDRLRSVRE